MLRAQESVTMEARARSIPAKPKAAAAPASKAKAKAKVKAKAKASAKAEASPKAAPKAAPKRAVRSWLGFELSGITLIEHVGLSSYHQG